MKKLALFLLIAFTFNSCTEEDVQICEANLVCTLQFESINVKFIDASGNPLIVKDFKSINLRTNKLLSAQADGNATGFYTVASDADLKDLTTSEKVLISAKHPITNVVKQADFIVSGGPCACHIGKVSGPDVIQF